MPKTGPLSELAGWVGRALESTGVGALTGAGVGAASNPDDPLQGATEGAVVGAGAGPLTLLGAKTVGKGAQLLGKLFHDPYSQRPIARRTMEDLDQAIGYDELSTDELRRRLTQVSDQPVTLADVGGENMLAAADVAAQVPGPARNRARQLFQDRFNAQSGRVRAMTQQYLSPNLGLGGNQAFKDIQKLKKDTAAEQYANVYRQGLVNTTPLNILLPRLEAAGALGRMETLAGVKGTTLPGYKMVELPDGTKHKVYQYLTAEQWDDAKRGLDDAINAAFKGGDREVGRELVLLKEQLLGELDTALPGYREARKTFAGYSSSQNAIEMGKQFDSNFFEKGDPDDLLAYFNSLDPGDQDFFRMGVGQRLSNLIGTGKVGQDAVKRFFSDVGTRDRLAAIFPTPQAFTDFSRAMDQELRFAKTSNTILGGSPTHRRQQAQFASERDDDDLLAAAVQSRGGVGSGLVQWGLRMLGHDPDKIHRLTGAELTKLMLNPRYHDNMRLLAEIDKRRTGARRKKVAGRVASLAIPAAGAAAAAALQATPFEKPQGMAEGGRVQAQGPTKPTGPKPGQRADPHQVFNRYLTKRKNMELTWDELKRAIGEDAKKQVMLVKDRETPILGTSTYRSPSGEETDVGFTDTLLPFSDELDAALVASNRWLTKRDEPWRQTYDRRLPFERGATDAFMRQHPVEGNAGYWLQPIPGGLAIPKAIARLAKLGPLAQMALTGGLYGGVTGFDQGEGGFKNRAVAALEQGLPAAAVLPMLPGLGRTAMRGLRVGPLLQQELQDREGE